MRKPILLPIIAVSLFTIVSCSQSGQNNNAQSGDSASTSASSSLMNDTKYDPTKIDPAALVTKITLHAKGNNMAEMSFDLKEMKVKAGSTVELTLINEASDASMQHNFVLIDDGSADSVAVAALKAGAENGFIPKSKNVYVASKIAMPGKTEVVTFPAPEKGTYEFICSYPGHYMMMRGKFIVQ